ncbi:MAG: hypothetical protein K9M97_06395 [Akkermansiaceae bacterium]|nr:hypothetical protein [Akkermansiaceae bacterium]
MKKYLVLLWLLLPLPVVVLHFGRGQQWLARDQAHVLVKQAQLAEQKEDWQQADQHYREATKLVAADSPDLKLRLDLAQVRTRFRMGDAVAAIDMADKLLDDPATAEMPAEFRRESRELAGRIHYYAGWVMRLEGASRELWLGEAELSRQNFRLLAEQSAADEAKGGKQNGKPDGAGDGAKSYTAKQQENLESAVQLQRLSLTELMARPLPKEGRGMAGQGLSEQMGKRRGQRGKGNQPGVGEGEDGPPQKGAGTNRFQPGSGS